MTVLQEIRSLGNIITAFIFPRKFYRRALLSSRKYYRRQEIRSLTVSWKLATSTVNDYSCSHLLLYKEPVTSGRAPLESVAPRVGDCYCRNGYI